MVARTGLGSFGFFGGLCLALGACGGESSLHRRHAGSGAEAGSDAGAGSSHGGGETGGGGSGASSGTSGASAGGIGGTAQGGNAGEVIGGAAGAGGSGGEDDAIEPVVVVVDAAANRFEAFDRHGEIVKNYVGELELGDDVGDRTAAVGYLHEPWDGQVSPPVAYLQERTEGLVEPLRASLVIVRAAVASGDAVKVRVLTARGELVAEHVIEGQWEAFHESPQQGYLFAVRYTEDSSYPHAAVFRMDDARLVWQGHVSSAAFARDDSHFVFAPALESETVGVVDLASGEVTTPLGEFPPGVSTSVQTALAGYAIVGGRVAVSGRVANEGRLWSIDWRGNVSAFGAAVENTDDTLQAFDADGTKAMWSRATNDLHPTMPYSFIAAYAIDLATTTAGEWNGPNTACFERPGDIFFEVESTALLRCDCDDGSCTSMATLPDAPFWTPNVSWSRDRGVVLVQYEWRYQRLPEGSPNSFAFSAAGTTLATLPNGSADLDETGRLVLVRTLSMGSSETFVVDLESGERHSLGSPLRSVIAYR